MKDAQLDIFCFIDDYYKDDLYNFIQDFKLHKLPLAIEDLVKNLYTNILDLVDDYLDFQIEC